MYRLILIIAAIADIIGFAAYGIDKRKARKDRWRISEKSLLLLAVFGGIGTFLGMKLFRHKTLKWYFEVVNTLMCIGQVALIGFLFFKGLI